MESIDVRESAFAHQTYQKIKQLCRQPINSKGLIPDEDIEELAQCLRDLKEDEASERPRTYAVLHMMNRPDLMSVFVAKGLRDNSFPYPDRRSLPPRMRKDEPDACHAFLDLQSYVMSPALKLEKPGESPHVMTESGDILLEHMGWLGKGGDAKVDKVRSKITGKIYARKKMHRHKDFHRHKDIQERFVNEVQILKKLNHDHLVRIIGSYSDAKSVAIIMVPVAEFDLKQYLKLRHSQLQGHERSRFRTYYGCLANAIAYLHENNIRHKDIKPNNILLKGDDIFITDFGTALEFEGDQSVTKGTVKVKTSQYQSPEVARGSPRGTASDIWSLGVTFLEMTTVLRCETLDSMQKFLKEHGSKQPYVFENIDGAMQWSSYLSKNIKLPRTDNAPMQWIKDMLEKKSSDRPNAKDLFRDIKLAHDGIFCCKQCRDECSTASETSSSEESGKDDTNTTKSSWLSANDTNKKQKGKREAQVIPDPFESSLHPRTSPLHRQVVSRVFGLLPNFSMASLISHRIGMDFKTQVSTEGEVAVNPEDYGGHNDDPYVCNLPGSFPQPYENHVEPLPEAKSSQFGTEAKLPDDEYPHKLNLPPSMRSTGPIQDIQYTRKLEHPSASNTKYSRILEGPVLYSNSWKSEIGPSIEVEDPKNHAAGATNQERIYDVSNNENHETWTSETDGLPTSQELSDQPDLLVSPGFRGDVISRSAEIESPVVETALHTDAYICNPGPGGFILMIPGAKSPSIERLRTLLDPISDKPLKRSRSDESIIIQRQTNYILDNVGLDQEFEVPKFSRRRRSQSFHLGEIEDSSRLAVTADLLASKKRLQQPNVLLSSPTSAHTQSTTDEGLLTATKDSHKGLDEPVSGLYAKTTVASEAASVEKPVEIAKDTSSTLPKTNSVSSTFTKSHTLQTASRAAETPRLTEDNLRRLKKQGLDNDIKDGVPLQSKTSPPRFKAERASVYMRKVFDDAASSVPTSIMSSTTRQRFKHTGLMLPLQDRTSNYLGHYTKLGKADAVRLLLKAGCCPGTKERPRTAPIFNVVRGASSRHTKCLRLLIDHGVNVNVKQNGTTPLIEAVEQEPWSGYVTVIYQLLVAGANPNTTDGSGDSPLLKLLGGGSSQLKDHHRKALALLLSPSWNTNVKISPLGTENKPLHLAIRRKDPYAVGMLLEKDGSVIESKNSEGLTPLLFAAQSWTADMSSDQLEVLDLLLEKGADTNAQNSWTHKTPLHVATSYGLVDVVERLLEFGADPEKLTADKKSVFDIADERKRNHG